MNPIEYSRHTQASSLPIFALLGASTALYAALLNTKSGRRIAQDETWLAVSCGTAIVLFFCRFILPPSLWNKVVLAFVIGGSPMIARSIFNK